jgi:hypothetical protein
MRSHGARLLVPFVPRRTGWNTALNCASSQNLQQPLSQKTPPESQTQNRKSWMKIASAWRRQRARLFNSSAMANITSRAHSWSTNSSTSTVMPRGGPSYLRRSYTLQASNIPAKRTAMETISTGYSTRGEYQCCQDRQLPLTAVFLNLLMQRAVLLSLLQVCWFVPAWATLRLTYGRAGTV